MGKIFDKLSQPGSALQDPSTGQDTFVGSPRQVLSQSNANLQSAFQPNLNDPLAPNNATLPRIGNASFRDAASVGATVPGGANALSPALSKGGKLLTLLSSGLEGAMAGRAASEQALAESGGRRSGGAGLGFQSGYQLPFIRAVMQQNAQRGALENQVLQNTVKTAPQFNLLKLLQGQSEIGKNQAEANKATAEAGAIPAKTALEQAQREAAFYKDDPNLGLIDIRTKQPVTGEGIAPLSPEEAAVLGKQPGERVPLKLKNTANEIAMRGITTVNTDEGVYERNRQTGQMTRLGANPRMVFSPSNRIIQVADPDHPGQTKFMLAGDAVKSGVAGPQSSSVVVPKRVLEWATTGKGGEEVNAFNTALRHADLLEQALTALDNGDVRTLNSIKNRFQTEFGSADMTNFQTIANAYSREVTKMLSSGHMTDAEIGSAGATLPANASPEQTLGALEAYRSLAASKMQMRYEQFQQGMQGKPNFPAGAGGGQGGISVTDPNGGVHTFPDQASANRFKRLAGIK